MSNRLNSDMCRCYGYNCRDKEACKRFLTIAIDAVDDELQGDMLRSYTDTLLPEGKTTGCEELIQADAQ